MKTTICAPPCIEWKARRLSASEALLRSAAERFACHGYHGTTVEAIARQAGVNKALVSYHFGGKEQLYLSVRRRLLGLFSAMEPAGQETAPIDRDQATRAWLHAITRQTLQVPSLPRLLLREELGDGPGPAAEGSVLEILARRMAQGQDVTRARTILVATLFHLARGGIESARRPLPSFLDRWLAS